MRSIAFWAINPTAKKTTDPKLPRHLLGQFPVPSSSLFARFRRFKAKCSVWFTSNGRTLCPDVTGKYPKSPKHARYHPLLRWMLSDWCEKMASIRKDIQRIPPKPTTSAYSLRRNICPQPWPCREIPEVKAGPRPGRVLGSGRAGPWSAKHPYLGKGSVTSWCLPCQSPGG